MLLRLIGKKKGMTQRFDEAGNVLVCTVIQAEPNVVTQIKTKENDGYEALQLGMEKIVTKDERTVQKRVTKPLLGHFKKNSIEPRRYLAETRLPSVDGYEVGQELSVGLFNGVTYVDVTGTSKGKGFQGVIKRYHFRGGPAAHGSGFHRHGGSNGQRSTPGRTFPGLKKAGHMGHEQVTVQNLKVVAIDEGRNLIFVEGAIPGPNEGVVFFSAAEKKTKKKA